MDEILPFLQDARTPASPAAAEPAERDFQAVARRAARLAADVDRRLAHAQPRVEPTPPAAREVREPAVRHIAGTTPLPYRTEAVDPAGVAAARSREVKGFPARVVECVACEYRKLETRLGDPARHGHDASRLSRDQRQHFGPGERDYTVCQTCHDANGKIPTRLYARWAAERSREGAQRTFRHDPAFREIAERVAEVDRWRRGIDAADLGSELGNGREREAEAPEAAEREYDGVPREDRVPTLSEFTGQTPPEGRSRQGMSDPEFSSPDRWYEPGRVGADETEAYIENERWEARRKESFRRAWERTGDIEDPVFRRQLRERLVQRWDPRMGLVGEDRMALANPFAPARPQATAYARSTAHSGVDEALGSEPPWKRSALARHEAAVAEFLSEARGRLARQGMPPERITELTTLPEINPGREIGKPLRDRPLHERIRDEPRLVADPSLLPGRREASLGERIAALRRQVRPLVLAPAAELDQVAQQAQLRDSIRDDLNAIGLEEAARGRVDADSFLGMADRARQRSEFVAEVRAAEAAREEVQKWAGSLRRADVELRGATTTFAQEIRAAFRDPQAFQEAFRGLEETEKRSALRTLRERPGEFAREFGNAGALRARTPPEMERAGVLTASAGERYLAAVHTREVTRSHAARHLGLPESANVGEVRSACAERMQAASERKSRAIAGRDALGRTPSPRELAHAFSGLHQGDRRRVLSAAPEIASLVGKARPRRWSCWTPSDPTEPAPSMSGRSGRCLRNTPWSR